MSRRSKQRKKQKDLIGYVFGLAAVVIISVIGVMIFQANKDYVSRDKNTQCREDGYLSKETAIIFDATDSFSETQALALKKHFSRIVEESKIDERFSMYVLSDSVLEYKPVLRLCNPGDGQEKSELTANKRRLLKAWQEGFANKVDDQIESLMGQHRARQSPIIEMIKYASIDTMLDSPAMEKKIYIVSDMLHNTPEYSHYSANNSYADFIKTTYSKSVRPSLDDVEIELYYLYRASNDRLQNRKHISFWESLFSESGGTLTNVKTIN